MVSTLKKNPTRKGRRGEFFAFFAFDWQWIAIGLLSGICIGSQVGAALPTFENRTPVGFSSRDSTSKEDFVVGTPIEIRVDLDQAATPTYPVVGHFHNLETSLQVESNDVDGLQTDIAVDEFGALHMAWITQENISPVSTPVYFVRYARSNDEGATFSSPISVSGALRFDLMTINVAGSSSGFSTLDIEVDSRGNPRIAYAMNHSPDGHTAKFSGSGDANNVYFNYSQSGGASWLPADGAIVLNDTVTVGNTEGRSAAFPRLAIDQRDHIYVTYVRGSTQGSGNDDIMLAHIDQTVNPFNSFQVGSTGVWGSRGGVRLSPDAGRQTGSDIDIGTGDVLHVVYLNDTNDDIEHKTLLGDSWTSTGSGGWNQDVNGADVDDFIDEATVAALEDAADFYFPTVAVDSQSSPNRIYAIYKFGDNTFETVSFNSYTYDNAIGGSAGWDPAAAVPIWSTATSPVFEDGSNKYNIELDWTVTERVAVVVDEQRTEQGALHIAFSAGYSSGNGEHDIYYGYYNGESWTLPEKVADDDSDITIEDGIATNDIFLGSPALAKASADTNVYLAFSGGLGEGLGVNGITNVDHHAYFKVLGRAISSEDVSVPVGAFAYNLRYTPTRPQKVNTEIENNPVFIHVADNSNGKGLGAKGYGVADGFLAGEWDAVGAGAIFRDNDKYFEGRINEDASSGQEWGDDDDKIGLLVKLNVLGSDSSTNIQSIISSTASGYGRGVGARSVRVGSDPTGSFVSTGSFFMIGADIDIVDSNTGPVIEIFQPDGIGDVASESFAIEYKISDRDDDFGSGSGLKSALYFSADPSLATVQDVQIFGTLIVDENDDPSVSSDGTGDFLEELKGRYSWGSPSIALRNKLFASITKVPSGEYYIYLIADDQKNPPVFVRSPGSVEIKHVPKIVQVDPISPDTVNTGVRTGKYANPYDLDFLVRDYDLQGATELQLFYSAVGGINSVSVSGTFPNQQFALGKSVAGISAIPIPRTELLTSNSREYSWDLTDLVAVRVGSSIDSQVVKEGSYYIYLVASDSYNVSVGQSDYMLRVQHSPSFTFYEPPRDTHRNIDSGSQPVYAIQWQKGRSDGDFDSNASIDLYFTTDNPAVLNYESNPDSLLRAENTRVVVKGLSENIEGSGDMYMWDFRNAEYDLPVSGTKIWLYAVIKDENGNSTTTLGGSISVTHTPFIHLLNSKLSGYGSFAKNDIIRLSWDDYLVDDLVGTDNAYIRLYASTEDDLNSLSDLEADIGDHGFLINSSNGLTTGAIADVREDSADFFDWNTRLFGSASTAYYVYAAISKDPTFNNNTGVTYSRSISALSIGAAGSKPNISFSPTDQVVSVFDTVTVDVVVQHPNAINFVQVIIKLGDNSFSLIDQSEESGLQPFLDLNNVFPNTNPLENSYNTSASQLRFSKATFGGQQVGSSDEPVAMARLQLIPTANVVSTPSVVFSTGETGTVLGFQGKNDPYDVSGDGLSISNPEFKRESRGQISAIVELEGRTLGDGNHTSLLDIHLRHPGSTIDISDAIFLSTNDDYTATADSLEVNTNNTGALLLTNVPAGRYVLTVKDTSHLSARTDTFTLVNGQTVTVGTDVQGFFASDLRGDPSSLLGNSGRRLIAGDVSGDNEINEDDVNMIIASWGTGESRADLNNDGKVGASDLTATTSNFGNNEGFGAPPVYKDVISSFEPITLEMNPLFDVTRDIVIGQNIEFSVIATDLRRLAGYEMRFKYDASVLRPLFSQIQSGDVFSENPDGAIFMALKDRQDELVILGSRYGKQWSASGDKELGRLKFEVLSDNPLSTLSIEEGLLLNAYYERQIVGWEKSLIDLILPKNTELEQNFPNPFNPTTSIPLSLAGRSHVRLAVFNLLGQKISTLINQSLEAGYHTIDWNGRDASGHLAAAGLYFYLLETEDFRQTRKMTLVK
ncbi:MAG: T9SS type A sorting domain-containing protein [Candidatus Latescibacterota bacterium]|nr:T9SS type A sorting domain-containing protein [Candidatus Latescibacterota bacterium]